MARIKHIALHTEDPAETADWYMRVFGLDELRRTPADTGADGVWLTDGYIYFAILKIGSEDAPNLGEGPSTVKGVHHIGFYVDDLDQAVATVEANDGTECPGSSRANRKYKGPDGLMIDLRVRGWDEQIRARSTLYELTEAEPKTPAVFIVGRCRTPPQGNRRPWRRLQAISASQQFADGVVHEFRVGRVETGAAGQVPPDGLDGPQFRVGHVGNFDLIVLGREIEVGAARHHDGLSLDRSQSPMEVSLVYRVGADVAILPSPEHRQKVVGVGLGAAAFPKSYQVVLQGRVPDVQVYFLTVESLGDRPTGVDPAHGPKSFGGRTLVPAAGPSVVGSEGGLHPLQEDEVVPRGLGRSADGNDAFHHVGKQTSPLVGLLAAHRPAGDHGDSFYPELLCDQAVLGHDVIVQGHAGKACPAVGTRGCCWATTTNCCPACWARQ